METLKIAEKAGLEIAEIESKVDAEQVSKLAAAIVSANRIFVCGAGRSLLMLRCFAMRLMHIGFNSYVVGDTVTPAFEEGDLLIVGSASGETENLVSIAGRAKVLGGNVGVLSIFSGSSLAKMADVLIRIPAYTGKLPESDENKPNILPGGSMFEISMLVLLDSLIIPLAETQKINNGKRFQRHANLE